MSVVETHKLSPRGIAALSSLKGYGLSMVEVKITEFSPTVGKRLAGVALPDNTRSVCVIRNNRPITELDAVFIEEGDLVYLLTDNESVVREIFTVLR